jgi:UDP-N-acetylglucosamine--N-acetylmuramyl-(pentapeptide) pyrophosphoryl-undecaprenol N-acetylglucosamine transferase
MEGFAGAFKRKQVLSKYGLIRFDTEKAVHIGNPLRKELLDCELPEKRFAGRQDQRIRLLIIGGSLGAQAINRFLPEFLAQYANTDKLQLWHQCGKNNLDDSLQAYEKAGIATDELNVGPFIDNMAQAYAWADLVLCRAGASTVSEIAAVGIPAVFVPYPYAVDNHQTENALILQKLGAAWIIQQNELSSQKLANILDRFLADRALILRMALLAKEAAKPQATQMAAGYCIEACYV